MQEHIPYMRRCFDLARLGGGRVAPNPMVGAVLVHENRIIGEGWHRQYGGPHAEVNCIDSVRAEDRGLIEHSTLYCSLEPCFHVGKTPPCVELVLDRKIPRVVLCNMDPNPLVAGKSIQKMKKAGVEVISGVLEETGRALNAVFFKWISSATPWVTLKWAQSADGFLGKKGVRTPVSGPETGRWVHKLRSERAAILVGNTTAVVDNPRLDTRLYGDCMPLRIAYDRARKIPLGHHLLDDGHETWIMGAERPGDWKNTRFFPGNVQIQALMQQLAGAKKSSLLVEGGADVLQQFISAGVWDEIVVIQSDKTLVEGVAAPGLPAGARQVERFDLGTDQIRRYLR